MEKIPTAEAFLKMNNIKAYPIDTQMMIEFAKLHVEAALKEAANSVVIQGVNSKCVINSYPLTNIK